MPVSSAVSSLLASVMAVLIFAGMQLYKNQLASSQLLTVLGGYLGSILFMLILTAVGNLETSMFGKNFQAQLFPEVVVCLLAALLVSGLVHRVCVTTCFIFSIVALYYMNKISSHMHSPPPVHPPTLVNRSKK